VVSHALVLLLPVVVLVGTDALSRDLLHQRQEEVERQGALVGLLLDAEIGGAGGAEGPKLAARVAPGTVAAIHDVTHAGVRILDRNGTVVATSGPRLGQDLSERAEVRAALAGTATGAARTEVPPALFEPRLDTRKKRRITWAYAAVPLHAGGETVGAVVLARPTREVFELFGDLGRDLGAGAAIAGALTLALSFWSGWRVSRSLRALAAIADRVAEGRAPDAALHAIASTRVSEVRLLARAFEAMAARLQARLRYNREFASNVSHEFKTPLTTLRGTVDLLVEDTEMPAAQRARFLANARTDLDRLHRLVGGLLELARAEEGTPQGEVDLDTLLSAAAARHPAVSWAGRAGRIPGDAAQIDLALENLLSNAHEHGGASVGVRAWREGGHAGFDVEDDGPGISQANLPRIFDRFFTTGRERRGTGLGLPLVAAVARAHGGTVTVESAPGHTRFRFAVASGGEER
jgi:signal transduction histidine kinase